MKRNSIAFIYKKIIFKFLKSFLVEDKYQQILHIQCHGCWMCDDE